jgi:hypothetical protein
MTARRAETVTYLMTDEVEAPGQEQAVAVTATATELDEKNATNSPRKHAAKRTVPLPRNENLRPI